MLTKVKEIISDMLTTDSDKITAEASLRDDLEMSSLDLINLAVELEKEFSVSISNKTIVSAHTVADVIAIIESSINQKQVAAVK